LKSRPAFDFTILDETEDWLVVDKPAPLQIHPSKPQDAGYTLWDGLRALLGYELVNGGQVSILNRLDRETSGLVLIAKNSATARRFGKAMMRRQIHKTYLAIVHGWPDWDTITLHAPILRQGEVMPSRIWVKQMVHESGAPCTTDFRVLQKWTSAPISAPPSLQVSPSSAFSLIEAIPRTGRMHQIRVHLTHLGLPMVGDKIYGLDETCYLQFIETGWTPELASQLLLPRQALHSHRLQVADEHGTLAWESPLPEPLKNFIHFEAAI
jgi:23S rRNA pseudouridine1911/1915/1917 synthase